MTVVRNWSENIKNHLLSPFLCVHNTHPICATWEKKESQNLTTFTRRWLLWKRMHKRYSQLSESLFEVCLFLFYSRNPSPIKHISGYIWSKFGPGFVLFFIAFVYSQRFCTHIFVLMAWDTLHQINSLSMCLKIFVWFAEVVHNNPFFCHICFCCFYFFYFNRELLSRNMSFKLSVL